MANDIFKDNQRCTIDSIIIITPPKHGKAIGTSDNYVDYTPNRHYYYIDKPDSLQYKIIDRWGQTSSAWVAVKVLEKNTPPVAVDDTFSMTQPGSIIRNVGNNDSDPDGNLYCITLVSVA